MPLRIQWLNQDNKKYLDQLGAWRNEVEKRLKQSLPKLLDAACQEAFAAACQAVLSADKSQQDAQAVLNSLKEKKPVDPKAVEQAQQAYQDAVKTFDDAMESCMKVAVDTILDKEPMKSVTTDSSSFDDSDLVAFMILNGNCKELAWWCDRNEAQAEWLMSCLHDTDLMRTFLESGGARSGKYGDALQLYKDLGVAEQKDPVLKRLALAVALELAEPYPLFNPNAGKTDAKKRYVHYEQAYLLGELDPNFSTFNVWELRQVVNSDATEEELSWGRQSLLDYRPDIALKNDAQWQYCQIVRTDVGYTNPDWYKKTGPSYDQILSGGGKCGPRAWYGRFICKAFGIPTWGVRQPGHAAMMRWTRNGWCVCLGGGVWKSWWGDQCGNDFLLETTARCACGTERAFLQKVLRVQWISAVLGENTNMVRTKGLPDPKSPWRSLDMMQRRRLGAACGEDKNKPMFERANIDRNTIAQMRALNAAKAITGDAVSCDANTGAIFIPASSCSSPGRKSPKVSFLPCFSGGEQLFLTQDAEVEFTLSSVNVSPGSYKLTCRVCTVHRSEQPIVLTVVTGETKDPDMIHEVKMPYTVGMWQETVPLIIEVGATTKLRFARPKQQYGFSFKEIILTPV